MTSIKTAYLGGLRTSCVHKDSGAIIETDAPKDNGGEGACFSPTDLLAASLASCMMTIMVLAAKQAGFDLAGATAEVEKEMLASPNRRIGKLSVCIRCPRSPSPHVREKLEQAALRCPVHESLHPDVKQEVNFVWGI